MANRTVFTSTSPPPVGGPAMLDNHAEKLGILFNNVALIPTSITNTGNDYTIVIDPTLDPSTDVVAGMMFYITPNVDCSGATRVRVTAPNPYHDVVKANADPLATGDFMASTVYGCLFIGGQFRILTQQAVSAAAEETTVTEYLTSTTWTKPTGLNPDAIVDVEQWAGGAGGVSTSGGGGGGGAYIRKQFKASDLTASVSLTIGAGGAIGSAGGNTTFGSYLTAFGGAPAVSTAGGGGGGQRSAGSGTTGGGLGGGGANTSSSQPGGGGGGGAASTAAGPFAYFGGGGGGGAGVGSNAAGAAGAAMYGGGGGGGGASSGAIGAAGVSTFGGNGGAGGNTATAPQAGAVPGGGGGGGGGGANATAGVGGAGKIIIRIIP